MSEGRYTCPKCGGADVDARPLSRSIDVRAPAGELMHCRCRDVKCRHEWDEEGCCGAPPEPVDEEPDREPSELDEDERP